MAIISSISRTFTAYVTPRKPVLQQRISVPPVSDSIEQRLEEKPLSPFTKAKVWLETSVDDEDSENFDGDTLFDEVRQSGKRPAPPDHGEKRSGKRQKSNDRYRSAEDDEDGDFEGVTLLASTPAPQHHARSDDKAQEDRQAMPPPPKPITPLDDQPYIPAKEIIDRNLQNNIVRDRSFSQDSVLDEDEIFTKKTAVRREDRSEVNPQLEWEGAFRHAQAQQLPEDSSTWSEAERDLFYRLAMRGFEPLIPSHWAMDFKTLPEPLFATKEDEKEPLILPFDERGFRAKHYLRSLFSIAARVRDRALEGLGTEPAIKLIIHQYISWALFDAGVHPRQRPRAIPVHALATKRRVEDTQQVLKRMSRKLYRLARRYQDVYCLQRSIEPTPSSITQASLKSDNKENSPVSASEYDDAHMPTLIGIMIASSVVAVVTLDSRASPPPDSPLKPDAPARQSSPSVSSMSNEENFGLRFIAKFDFSTHDGYDVWDGLAVAICIMRIRKTMLELCEKAESEGQAGKGGLWERVGPGKAEGAGSENDE